MREDAAGWVFSIQSFCVDDGPGIRTAVYLKGCNMRCAWCHNPESLSFAPQLSFTARKCTLCGACAKVCGAHKLADGRHVVDRAMCNACARCVPVCRAGALEVIGERMTSAQVLDVVCRDKRYFDKSGGGMTVTGGEPMMQLDFLIALLSDAKARGLNTALETNGTAAAADYLRVLPLTDLFLFDIKLTDQKKQLALTGVSGCGVLETLETLLLRGAQVVLRCPIIPDVNDNEAHFRQIARLSHGTLGFQLMPYHALGVHKAARIGSSAGVKFGVPDKETISRWQARMAALGGKIWEGQR